MIACDRENRNVTIRIDLAAIRHNVRRVRALAPGKKIFAVVKADAYGHGAERILPALQDADALAVAHVAEGMALRHAGEMKPVLVMQGFRNTAQLDDCLRAGLWPVVHHRDQLEMLKNNPKSKNLSCWVKFDTGMGRLGFTPDRANTVHRTLQAANVHVLGIMTHLASADRENDLSTDRQLRVFKSMRWPQPIDRSVCNSAALLSRHESHFDWVRPGIMLYGASPFACEQKTAEKLGLQPAMRVTAPVTAIRNFKRGDRIGYGGLYECKAATKVAIIGAGYADGYPCVTPNVASVMLGNQRCPLRGRISMDTMAVDVSALSVPPPIDFPVTLWGHAQLGVDEIACTMGVIPYELLCTIRGKRSWLDASSRLNVRRINEDMPNN